MTQTADLEYMLEEAGGEMTPELEEAFDKLAKDLSHKVDGYGYLMRKLKANIDASKSIIKDMQAAVKAKENNLKNLKEHIAYNMQMYGMDRLSGETCNLSLRRTTVALLGEYNDIITSAQAQLPSWITLKAEVSKTELKNQFKHGEALPNGMIYKDNVSVQVR